MSIPIGNLVLEMAANMARIRTDIEAARKTVDTGMNAIKKSAEVASKALGALGIGLSAGMFAEWVRGAIDAADKLNDLSKSTGLAVKQLAGLKLAANQSGGDLDGIAASINKLSVNIGGNADKFAKLGVTAKDPLEAFKQLSDIFVAVQDPQLRAALGAETLGKSWASAAPLLMEGSARIGEMVAKGEELSNMTPELAAAADKLNDILAEMKARSEGVANAMAKELLPLLNTLAESMNEANRSTSTMSMAMEGVRILFETIVVLGANVGYVLKMTGLEIAGIIEQLATMAGGGGWNAAMAVGDRMKAEAAQARKDVDDFTEKVLRSKENSKAVAEESTKATEAETAAVQKNVRAFLDSNKEKAAGVDLYAKMIKQADDLVASIEFETKLLTMNNVEKETAVALQKLANMGIKEGTEEYKKYSEAIIAATLDKAQVQSIIDSNKKFEEARLDAIKKAEEAQKKMEEDAANQLRDISNQVGQSFADALMNGGKNAADYLKDLFRTLVLTPIVQPLIGGALSGILLGAVGTASAGTGSLGAGATMGAGGMLSGSGGIMQSVNSLKNLYDMVTGSFASMGTQVSNLVIDAASWMQSGAEVGSFMKTAGTALAESASAIGSAASVIGGAGAGLGLGNLISGGKSVGGSSWGTVGGGTAVGAALGSIVPGLGTALGAAAGGILGGLVNAAFGSGPKEYTGSGIKGSFSTGGVNAMAYQSWEKKGGWFGGGDSGNDYTALTDDVRRTLDTALQGVGASVSNLVDVLGVKVGSVSEFSQDINIALDGLSPEEINKKIAESVTGFADSLTSNLIPEIANFAKQGESSSATLNRLGTALSSVNAVMSTLGLRLMDTSLAGASASSALVDLFGTVDQFVQSTNYYYQNFYSEQERAAKTTEQLSAAFAQFGVVMPGTKDAFRAMVESARAAGNDALFANLLKLAPAFSDLDASLAKLGQSSIQAAQDAALADLDRQRTAAQAAQEAASESVSALKSLFDYLREQVSGILQVADMSAAASNGISFISDALAAAKSTGYLPEQSALADAVSAARSGLVSSNFASSYDMRLAQMKLAADLQGLADITGGRKTIAEQQLAVAQEQLAAIEAQTEVVKAYYAAQLAGSPVRGYASGGNYPGGLAMVGEQGPELINFNSPGTVYTASQTQRMLSGGAETAEEIRMLRQENKAQAAAMVQMQARMARLMERWDGDGVPSTRVETA